MIGTLLLLLQVPVFAGRTYYLRWDEEAVQACAKAVLRITKPYQFEPTDLSLVGQGDARDGEFTHVGFMGRSKKQIAAGISRFPSLKNSPDVKKAIAELDSRGVHTLMLNEFLPGIVREPKLLSRPLPTDRILSNCFGSALGWYGYTNQWFSLDDEQVDKILAEYFKKIPKGGKVPPESLVIWRNPQSKRAEHAAVILGVDLIWNKPGSNPAVFSSFGKAMNFYGGRDGGRGDALIEFYRLKGRLGNPP